MASADNEPVYSPALRELLNSACTSRKIIAAVYFAILASWIVLHLFGLVTTFSPLGFLELWLPTPPPGGSNLKIYLFRIIMIVVFFALQGLFLFGGGRMRITPGRVGCHRMIFSLIVFATFMVAICAGFGLCYADIMSLAMPAEISSTFVKITAGAWIFWLVVGFVATCRTNQFGALSRLTITLIAGSWVEFAVALPVYLVSRQKNEDCPCLTGSFFALVFGAPMVLWSVGPGIVLLFLREKAACKLDKRHSRKILLERSVRHDN